MAFMLLASLAVAAMNACVRHVSGELHPFEIAFFRSLFGLAVLAPILIRLGFAPFRTRKLHVHAVRGALIAASMMTGFWGLSLVPLAKFTALFFSAPLFGTVLAWIALREKVRFPRLVALAVGFAGTLIILRPGGSGFDPGTVLAVMAAALWGVGMIVIKVLARTESNVTITVYVYLFVTPIAFVAALGFWQTPTIEQLAWLALIGAFGTTVHMSLAQAFRDADVTAVLPLEFTKLIWASAIGFAAFAEIPDLWTWVGGGVIFSSAAFIAHHERPGGPGGTSGRDGA
ncbi:MAG: DMT family transporter [Rhodospirillales bacterium]|jgi:drug/metabolite transporter (DMT)-like permease|nr:DMT family transporter [Rhodospirillales bacterium]